MDIHKPKPFHGWREFLKEYGIIVLGVLTALALEQTVEWLHWRGEVRETRAALRQEIAHDLGALESLKTENSCIGRRLDALNTWAAAGDRQLARPSQTPLLWTIRSSVWDVAKTGQVASHFPLEERLSYARMYDLLTNEWSFIQGERAAWERIDALANSGVRDADHLVRLRDAVADARELGRIRFNNHVYVDPAADELGIKPEKIVPPPGRALDNLCEPI
ncbi:MAG TPA: hypothetical protein VGG92_21250 [Caulobacteraceae bacterium]|jgi:hypothetical protein